MIRAYDYNGKYFTLQDEENAEEWEVVRKDVDVNWYLGEGLINHVISCRYFGIPAYVGRDRELHERINKISNEVDKEVDTLK